MQDPELVVGRKKSCQEATVLVDPKTSVEVNSVTEIKRVSLEYCKNLLTNRSPKPGYENIIKEKEKLHDIRMAERMNDYEVDLNYEIFISAIE